MCECGFGVSSSRVYLSNLKLLLLWLLPFTYYLRQHSQFCHYFCVLNTEYLPHAVQSAKLAPTERIWLHGEPFCLWVIVDDHLRLQTIQMSAKYLTSAVNSTDNDMEMVSCARRISVELISQMRHIYLRDRRSIRRRWLAAGICSEHEIVRVSRSSPLDTLSFGSHTVTRTFFLRLLLFVLEHVSPSPVSELSRVCMTYN